MHHLDLSTCYLIKKTKIYDRRNTPRICLSEKERERERDRGSMTQDPHLSSSSNQSKRSILQVKINKRWSTTKECNKTGILVP